MISKIDLNNNITEDITPKEVSTLLTKIWGESPLSQEKDTISSTKAIRLIQEGDTEVYNKSISAGVRVGQELIATASLRIHPWMQVELGGIAVHPNSRGKGLAQSLFRYLSEITPPFLDAGYSFSMYATLGSAIMYKACKIFKTVTNTQPVITCITPYIVITETNRCMQNIESAKYVDTNGNTTLTSTVEILSQPKQHPLLQRSALAAATPEVRKLINQFPQREASHYSHTINEKNSVIETPHRLVVIDIDSPQKTSFYSTLSDLQREAPTKLHLTRIPILDTFGTVLSEALKCNLQICGITFKDDVYRLCFINEVPNNWRAMLKDIESKNIPGLSSFAKSISQIS